MTAVHPDIADLERLAAGEDDSALAGHVRGCSECAAVVADLSALRSQLQQLSPVSLAVPEEIDRRILWAARKHALEIRRTRPSRRRLLPWTAALAAGLLAALATVLQLSRHGDSAVDLAQRAAFPPAAAPARTDDFDGNGTVDILDAFALARSLDQGRTGVDVNGDGRIDHADVDAIAHRAVALGDA